MVGGSLAVYGMAGHEDEVSGFEKRRHRTKFGPTSIT
jgi:hypothetical protein